jgi:hypothetical protein
MSNAHGNAYNKNVELGERDTLKRFKHGISGYILGERRVDGGWHIAMYVVSTAHCPVHSTGTVAGHEVKDSRGPRTAVRGSPCLAQSTATRTGAQLRPHHITTSTRNGADLCALD